MNFKNLTNVAVVALLFTGISSFAIAPEGLVYFHIQNSTHNNFNIENKAGQLGKINAGDNMIFSQSLDINSQAGFFLKTNDKFLAAITLGLWNLDQQLVAKATLRTGEEAIVDTQEISPDSANDYHLYINLKGDEANKFAGSSIKLEVITPEIKYKKELGKERQQIETGRLQERLQPKEQSIEQLLKMKRQ